jgi:hypothetical protein
VGADIYRTKYAPADYNETVNTMGRKLYAKQAPMEFDKGIKLEVQTNTMSWCTRPKALVGGITSN